MPSLSLFMLCLVNKPKLSCDVFFVSYFRRVESQRQRLKRLWCVRTIQVTDHQA